MTYPAMQQQMVVMRQPCVSSTLRVFHSMYGA